MGYQWVKIREISKQKVNQTAYLVRLFSVWLIHTIPIQSLRMIYTREITIARSTRTERAPGLFQPTGEATSGNAVLFCRLALRSDHCGFAQLRGMKGS